MSVITHLTSLSQHNSLLEAKKDKLVVIDFHATWCGPCHAIAPKFEQMATQYKGVATFCKVDVDAAADVAKQYGIRAMPTFVFLKGGVKVDEVRGANAPAIEAAIRKHTGGATTGPLFPGSGQTLSGATPSGGVGAGGPAIDYRILLGIVLFGLWFYFVRDPSADQSDMPSLKNVLPPSTLLAPSQIPHHRTFLGVSSLNSLRSTASASPADVNAQVALFEKLVARERTEERLEVVARYEELTRIFAATPATPAVEGVSTGEAGAPPVEAAQAHPLLQSDEAFRLYLTSLASAAGASDLATSQRNLDASEVLTSGELLSKIAEAPVKRAELLGASASSPIVASTTVTDAPSQPAVTPSPAPATPLGTLSPAGLITTLFSGVAGRGKGGDAKVISTGAFKGWGGGVGTESEPIRVLVEEAKSPILLRMLKFVGVTLLYSFLLLSLLSLLLDSSGILRATAQTSPFSPTAAPDPGNAGGRGTTFKDVHGVEEAKLELYEIVEFLKDPKKFEKLGGRLPRGVLLTGPPGTGKTLLARAVAGEAGVNFFSASGSEFDEMYVGVGARRIRELFAAARKAAPAIIFLDEIDAVGGKRSPRDQHYTKQTLNQLLVEMDGFNPGEGVILIGATNFPESLDKALIRPGRFDRHVVVPLPDVRGRMQILTHHLQNIGYDKIGVDISTIARGTIGFSGADLQALVNQAAVKASADNASAVRASHFEWAKERIMMGAARKSAYITDKDKLATAYHEGGHALVALYTPGAYPLQSVTVIPRGQALGYTLMLPEMDKNSHTLMEYRAKLDVAMGGRVAEEIIYGKENVTDGASSDISSATSMASNMVRRFGFSDVIGPVSHTDDADNVSPQTQAAIEGEIRGLVEGAQTRAMALLRSKKVELDRLARALVEHETLDLEEVQKVIKGEKLTKSLEN
ncbi:hypothetical protein MNV49_002917 [Pseudohyphozyma bogoriensis]|nr:hypothetical protein MNV49_002917 [Pseudohyphozyma bogoriensis]